MSITRGEFAEFEKRMDERHAEIMGQLCKLPCSEHSKQLEGLNRLKWGTGIVTTAMGAMVLYFKDEIKTILGIRG